MEKFANNASSTLAVGISNSDLSLTVQTGDGAEWPTLGVGEYCWTTLSDGVNVEIVQVTARAGDVLTIVRGQQGTAAAAWLAGATVELRLTAHTLDEIAPIVSPPETGRLLLTVGGAAGWAKFLVNDAGDILTDDQYQIVHENNLGGADVPHSKYTRIAGGIHTIVSKVYASSSARTTDTSLTAQDVSKIHWQTSDNTFWALTNHSPRTWAELSNSEIAVSSPISDYRTLNTNDYLPVGWDSDGVQSIFLDLGADISITGLGEPHDGRPVQLMNASTAYTLTLTHDDPASSAGQRFNLPGGTPLVIPPRSGCRLVYSSAEATWIMVHGRVWPKQVGISAGTVASGTDARFNKISETTGDVWHEWEPHYVTSLFGDPFVVAVISAGVLNNVSYPITDDLNNGRNLSLRVRSSATANAGARIYTENLSLVAFDYGATYRFVCRFQISTALANRTIRMGFHDAVSVTDAVDGIYIEYSPSTVKGKTSANSVRSTTATTFTPTVNTWYTAVIATDGFDSATFEIIDESTGDSVWSDYLAISEGATFPLYIARTFAVAVVLTESSTVATNIGAVSYIGFGTETAYSKKSLG